jgi:hypothetical protein
MNIAEFVNSRFRAVARGLRPITDQAIVIDGGELA